MLFRLSMSKASGRNSLTHDTVVATPARRASEGCRKSLRPFGKKTLAGASGWYGRSPRCRCFQVSYYPPVAQHLLSMEAWSGCYVPAGVEPGSFQFDGERTELHVASMIRVVSELESVGTALGLPTGDDGLRELSRYYYDNDLCDDDMEIQTYAQLLLAARTAQARRQVLWIVK